VIIARANYASRLPLVWFTDGALWLVPDHELETVERPRVLIEADHDAVQAILRQRGIARVNLDLIAPHKGVHMSYV
jgi:hypothetical protein